MAIKRVGTATVIRIVETLGTGTTTDDPIRTEVTYWANGKKLITLDIGDDPYFLSFGREDMWAGEATVTDKKLVF